MFPNDLFTAEQNSKKRQRIYTVSEITQDIKIILENAFAEVWIEGEVSNVSRISTGTIFFNLKDNNSLLKCVVFASYAPLIKFELKDGLHMICFGRISVYEKDGKYQLYVRQAQPKGIGSLQLALEQLKEKLEKEGLFSPAHKRPIPYLPSRIGIVTSATGAAVKDILKVLNARFSDVHIIIGSARVQGEGAKDEIAGMIKDFNRMNQRSPAKERVEVLIVGRGGGSTEDLWAFNEEVVARAIYDSNIPVISAVGHERDWSIADLVADLRAPTPSAAAEMVIPKKEDLKEKVDTWLQRLGRAFTEDVAAFGDDLDHAQDRLLLNMDHILELTGNYLDSAKKKLSMLNPIVLIPRHKDRVLDLIKQINVGASHMLKLKDAEFIKALEKISGLNPLNILSRGYSVTFKLPQGQIIKTAASLCAGDRIKTRLHNGEIFSQVTEVK